MPACSACGASSGAIQGYVVKRTTTAKRQPFLVDYKNKGRAHTKSKMASRTSYDARLRHPGSKILVSGASGSGKTKLFTDMVLNHEKIFTNPFKNVIVFYREDQPEYDRLRQHCPVPIQFIKGEPEETLDAVEGTMLIFDDMQSMFENTTIGTIFQVKCRHRGWSCMMIQHLIFSKSRTSRLITLNCTAIIVFQQRHDKITLSRLSTQLEGVGMARLLPSIYKELSQEGNNHFYLLIDLDIECPESFKYRNSVFPQHGKTIVFLAG